MLVVGAFTWASQNWPFIVAVATVVATTTAWIVNVLRVRQLRYQIERLRWEAGERDRRIHPPTAEEVRTYGKPRPSSNLTTIGTVITPVLVLIGGSVAVWHLNDALHYAREAVIQQRATANAAQAEVTQLRNTLTRVLEQHANDHGPVIPPKRPADPVTHGNDGVFPLTDLDREPHLMYFVSPPYPVDPRIEERHDFIVVAVLIAPTGDVLASNVVTDVSPEVAAITSRALQKWRYSPGESKGGPVTTRILQAVTFNH